MNVSSADISATGSESPSLSTKVSHAMTAARPGAVSASLPARVPSPRFSTTMTDSTDGQSRRASSRSGSMATCLRRRAVPSATMTALASASCNRDAMAVGANPENSGTSTAPIRATAYRLITAAGTMGR